MELRRIFHGSLIILALWGTSLGFVGFAVAGESTGAPAQWSLPEHLVGDRGSYTVTLVQQDGDDVTVLGEEVPLFDFAWLEPTIRFDPAGQAHHVFRLAEQPWGRGDAAGTKYTAPIWEFDSTTGEMVSYAYESSSFPESGQRQIMPLNEDAGFFPPCGTTSALAGTSFDPREEHVLFPRCDWEFYWAPDAAFEARAMDRLGDQNALYFERSDARNDDQDIHLWLSQDHPYPLRYAVEDQNHGDRFYVIRLATFERGHSPMIAAPAVGSLPPMTWIDFDGALPAESADHPYPARQAYADSTAHPDGAELRAFLEQHPEAYVATSNFDQRVGSRDIVGWRFVVCDGPDRMGWELRKETEERSQTGTALDAALEEETLTWLPLGVSGGHCPTRAQLPTQIPSPTWLRAYYEAVTAHDLVPGWSIWATCTTSECDDVRVKVGFAAHFQDVVSSPPRPVLPPEEHSISSMAWVHHTVDPLGRGAVDIWEVHWPDCGNGCSSDDLTPSGFEFGPQSMHGRVAYDTELWSLPGAKALAGAGILSTLAGLLYFFWPTLKGGMLAPLFSRIQGPAVAEHPRRRAILDLVAASPGISLRAAQRQVGAGRGGFDHHVRKLQDAGLVKAVEGPGHVALFLAGSTDHGTMAGSTAFRSEGARALAHAIAQQPGATLSEVARAAGISPATAHHHAKRMETMGMVDARKEAGRKTLALTKNGSRALALAAGAA